MTGALTDSLVQSNVYSNDFHKKYHLLFGLNTESKAASAIMLWIIIFDCYYFAHLFFSILKAPLTLYLGVDRTFPVWALVYFSH